ncbi:MAG: hypothetical protein AABW51_04945 [Nanoarchaeota archaeon]
MTIDIALPFVKKGNVDDLVFTILTKEYPLRVIDLMNLIRKRYGKSVTFQAVRKAVLQLMEKEVLVAQESRYSINKEWVLKSKELVDSLYEELNKAKTSPKSMESIKGEITVFSFDSLNDLMKFWQNLINDWFKKFKKGDYGVNYYQSAHAWEGLLHPDIEKSTMHQLKQKGIKCYIITTGNTPLDRQIAKFYSKLGITTQAIPSSSTFDKSYYVGTYGDLVIQTQYPQLIVKLLDAFFKKTKSLTDVDLVELSNIVNRRILIKLTIIKDLAMAKQINKSIHSYIE